MGTRLDILMLVLMRTGVRTPEEFATVLGQADLTVTRVVVTGPVNLLEGRSA